ncbi:MAG: SDR family NAD(P)-dependent oxidoreductase [Mycobacterium sp.]|uniref:SDR family NAD(P)-dependent oxidoreductase n=1 Tax=Mycobacterium sp. TaxID=1785 RepID=UPI00389A1FCF
MSTPKVILVTGASSGFGAMTVRALADAKHVIYAGMRDIRGRNAQAAAAAKCYADEHGVILRPIEMDVSDQASVDGAVAAILAETHRIDVVIHNAGHMVLGPTEAFTPQQVAAVYDTNVLSTQRVNRAVLPAMRVQRDGLVLWVGSSSSRGGTPPYLGPNFAAKAAEERWRSATPPSSPGSESRRRSSCPGRSRRAPTISPMPGAPPTNTSRRPTKPSTRA